MTDYSELVKALRCKRDDCEGCDLAFLDNDEGWICQYAAKEDDAADAIEELQAELKELCDKKREFKRACGLVVDEFMPKRGEWELIDEAEPMRWGCSRCKYLSWETSSYCPRCGAKMEVRE